MIEASVNKQLILMRHGDASYQASSDSERPLTRHGIGEVAKVALTNTERLSSVQRLYNSPYLRAKQTARVLTENHITSASTELPIVTPSGSIKEFSEWLEKQSETTLMVVTHQPFIGDFFNWFTGCEPGRYVFGTANIAALTYDVVAKDCASLEWFSHP